MQKLIDIVAENEKASLKTIIFSEDRLTLAAERAICNAVGGTFFTQVYTFSRFLSSEKGKNKNLLSSQGSAMVIRKLIDENKSGLKLFKKLSSTSASESLYSTIALLYAAGITASDLKDREENGLLGDKLHDIALIYGEYENYLERTGKEDRNGYLRKLHDVILKSEKIKDSEVIFLGFQAFTGSTLECVKASIQQARGVTGLFIGGKEEIYVNEALTQFVGTAKAFGGTTIESVKGAFNEEAEQIRRNIFDGEAFFRERKVSRNVHIFESSDGVEEFEYIAASIKKYVSEGKRYAKISVMLPDIKGAERSLNRIFTQYKIPYYADRRFSLIEHPVCEFILGYMNCLNYGCRAEDVDGVVASSFLGVDKGSRDIFRNYALRLAAYRGGVLREPKEEILADLGYDYAAVQEVRAKFLGGLSTLKKGVKQGICGGIRLLLEYFKIEDTLKELAKLNADNYPMESEFCSRVYEGVLSVLAEAEFLEDGLSPAEFIKVLKSGLQAAEISLIPPKSDAVFVGDLASTANTGSDIVFAARLTGEVPTSRADTSLLSDREIDILEEAKLAISPKIRQVNLRQREVAALNLCAFREKLYLSYPVKLDGEEQSKSEIVSYILAMFVSTTGGDLKILNMPILQKSGRAEPYFCSEVLPALKRINLSGVREDIAAATYEVLSKHGFQEEADKVIEGRKAPHISCGERLFAPNNSVSPTTIETYFSCPYKNFIRQGLNLKRREEGAFKETDTGNFIHGILQDMKETFATATDSDRVASVARSLAYEKLQKPPFAALADLKSGEYTESILIEETAQICVGAFEQLTNSDFKLAEAEKKCSMPLVNGVNLKGQIDRIDISDEMVRIIDYKTGTVQSVSEQVPLYYMGTKLQLPLYLLASSKGKRAVGAYYFPASVNYSTSPDDGVFRLIGFMDGSEEVVSASDKTAKAGQKSRYIDATFGKLKEGVIASEDFADFLNYSKYVASGGVSEMLGGNITPSPHDTACEYCDAKSLCGFRVGVDGSARENKKVKCGKIVEISRRRGQ